MFYILHGEEEFGRAKELAGLRARLAAGDPAMAELNTTILDGAKLDMGELRHACDSIPFMADRRLVIVHGLLGRLTARRKSRDADQSDEGTAWQRAFMDELAAYLPALPPTTRLVFVEEKSLSAGHPILKVAAAETQKKRGYIRHFPQLKDGDLPRWIRRHIQDQEGQISSEAVALLAALVGADLRLLDQELEKLLLYADGQQITTEHVRDLVSRARETSIFDLVDCVGRRQTDQALRLLHRLLDDSEAPLYLLAMLARQIRILIQVRELSDEGLAEKEMASRLRLHPFVVKKGLAQMQNFSQAKLEMAHQALVDADWAIKTGEMEDVLALDTLVVALTGAS